MSSLFIWISFDATQCFSQELGQIVCLWKFVLGYLQFLRDVRKWDIKTPEVAVGFNGGIYNMYIAICSTQIKMVANRIRWGNVETVNTCINHSYRIPLMHETHIFFSFLLLDTYSTMYQLFLSAIRPWPRQFHWSQLLNELLFGKHTTDATPRHQKRTLAS